MSFRLSRLTLHAALGICWACAGGWGPANAQENTPKPAPANRPVPATETNVRNGRPDALKQLENELSRALGIFSSKNSPDAAPTPQYRAPVVVVPSKRARDDEERRKNWLWLDTDKAEPSAKEQDWTKSLDRSQDSKEKKNPLDEFYNQLNRERSGSLMPTLDGNQKRNGTSDSDSDRDNGKLPSGIRESAQRLRETLFNTKGNTASTPSEGGALSDLFGGGDKELSPADIRAHKSYMDEYRKVLDGAVPASSSGNFGLMNPLAPLGATSGSQPQHYLGGLDSLGGSSSIKTLNPGNVTEVAAPATFADPSAKVLNNWNPLYSAPKIEAPKPPPLAVQPFEPQRRRF